MIIRYCTFFSLFISFHLNGQNVTREFFDKEGNKTIEAGSYYYSVGKKVSFVRMNAAGFKDTVESYVDTVRTYYTKSDVLKSKKIYNASGFLEGMYLSYHENGKIENRATYFSDRFIGYFMTWYPDGKQQKVLQYFKDGKEVSNWLPVQFKIINYWDSTGQQLVNTGNGQCRCYFEKEKGRYVLETGNVKNGVRDSTWKAFRGDTLIFEEEFKDGSFLKGVSYYGEKHDYHEFEEVATFEGGYYAMAKHLQNNLQYPMSARRRKIQGDVYVEFVVDKDGSLYNIRTVKGVHPDLDAEAMRVVKNMPRWVPGRQRGRPVKSRFVLPIKFKLS